MKKLFYSALILCCAASAWAATDVVIETNMGKIELSLDEQKAPITVKNFVQYANDGYYNGTIFHRVIPGFMIQGGGFQTLPQVKQPLRAPIRNEAHNGLKNVQGTIAMARTSDPDSATAQFFINLVDNPFLDYKNNSRAGAGYAVFGKVISGMDVVKKIGQVPTQSVMYFDDVPVKTVTIEKVTVKSAADKKQPTQKPNSKTQK